ncbi:PAS domain-containing protein [Pontibacter pamirensis]|uniref:PAS domain-containing protein n=1 Tax=Pontibacter pamirensis TaxID=2562824 RepID=UPI0021D197AF|nr:PAS domain-containing protein [Pontibacter pamirensis]
MRIKSRKTEAQNQPTELSDALENYFSNTIISQLFVDADMVLRKFTPPAMKHFNLSPDDLGKHMNEMSGNIPFPTSRRTSRR